jgi:hypothetical protein
LVEKGVSKTIPSDTFQNEYSMFSIEGPSLKKRKKEKRRIIMMSSVDLTGISSPSNPSQGLNGPSSSYHGRSNEQIPSHHQPQYQQQQHYPHQQHHVRMPTAAQAASSSTGPAGML